MMPQLAAVLVAALVLVSPIDAFVGHSWAQHSLLSPSFHKLHAVSDDNDVPFFLSDPSSPQGSEDSNQKPHEVDVAIIGAGLGGLCAGAILNTLYGKTVGIYESHYLAGGCAHAFPRKAKSGQEFIMDSGPTILLGCSQPPWNALQQILQAVDCAKYVDWIPYDGWGMIEHPTKPNEQRWKVQLGPQHFERGPLSQFGGPKALEEYQQLQEMTKPLLSGVKIPAMAMRSGPTAIIPLLFRHFDTLKELIDQGDAVTGTFAPWMDGPEFVVTDPWLRHWLDALAFSLSGLPASRTAAAAMAFTIADMHKPSAALDYPKGGMGTIVDALVKGVEQGPNGSKVHLRRQVKHIDFSDNGKQATGITLSNGQKIIAKDGVICNAPVWSLRNLVQHDTKAMNLLRSNNDLQARVEKRRTSWTVSPDASKLPAESATIKEQRPLEWDLNGEGTSLLEKCGIAEQTGSFLHLHLALNSTGLDLEKLEAHYTVMDRGLGGEPDKYPKDGPCGELNMIAVSNPCKIDQTLAPPGTIVVHAYGAGNEPYDIWEGMDRRSEEYKQLKDKRATVLWRAVESVIPDARDRVLIDLTGSPLTHERFLRRPQGTYGSATEDYLKDGATPIEKLVLAGDGIFPGIGVPAVALSGASAANSLVNPFKHWQCLDKLKAEETNVAY